MVALEQDFLRNPVSVELLEQNVSKICSKCRFNRNYPNTRKNILVDQDFLRNTVKVELLEQNVSKI